MKVAIIVPTLGRPHRIAETIENVKETAPSARVHFVVEETDTESVKALGKRKATVGDFGTYAKAINAGYLDCPEPVVMTSDDDCIYHDGWLEAALAEMQGHVRVVGTNDLHNPYVLAGVHSTHSLIDRRYIDEVGGVIDGLPGVILFEYDHN